MKRISNFVQTSCPYFNFPQGSSGHLPRIKLKNTCAQQHQPAKSEETQIWKAVHLMWLTWWKTSTWNLTYKIFANLPESVHSKLWFANSLSHCNFPLFLNVFMARCHLKGWLLAWEQFYCPLANHQSCQWQSAPLCCWYWPWCEVCIDFIEKKQQENPQTLISQQAQTISWKKLFSHKNTCKNIRLKETEFKGWLSEWVLVLNQIKDYRIKP